MEGQNIFIGFSDPVSAQKQMRETCVDRETAVLDLNLNGRDKCASN